MMDNEGSHGTADGVPAHLQTAPDGLLRGRGLSLGPNATSCPREQRSLLRVLRKRAQTRGDHAWLIFDGSETLTFAAADRRANQVAHALGSTVGDNAHVALMLRNQVEFMPAFYGAQAAGGVAVPLNPESKGPLLHQVLTKSEARVIVVRNDLLGVVAELEDLGGVELVVVTGPAEPQRAVNGVPVVAWTEWLQGQPVTPPQDVPSFDQICLLQFTSGTTGRAKGAIYSHHFLHLFAAMITDSQQRTADDVLFTPLPLCHVAALHLVANSALVAGCTAHLTGRFSASRFWTQVAESGATWSIILGPMAAMVMKTSPQAPPHRMRHMFCVPPPPERRAFEERYGVKMLWQGYGMTEIYPLPMPLEMRPGVAEDTLGIPVDWFDYGVVDEHDTMLPPDTVGELVFRPLMPHGMVDGYYKEPAATAHAFRNFAFHTGDLATYDNDGVLHYRGRRQERIRTKGENVSATEVEYVALRHPCVVEAACFGMASAVGEDDVKLDVAMAPASDIPVPSLADLHDWLQGQLPRFMVPRYLQQRASFPKTPSERIQKWKLADESLDSSEVFDAGERRRGGEKSPEGATQSAKSVQDSSRPSNAG